MHGLLHYPIIIKSKIKKLKNYYKNKNNKLSLLIII